MIFFLLHEGKVLQETSRLIACKVSKNSTILLMHRLQGGVERSKGMAGPASYKEAACSKGQRTVPIPSTAPSYAHANPYIVEKLDSTPVLEIKNPQDEYQEIFLQGPWFWGRVGLFITPWFPEFDANTMVVIKMPVWVRLQNLPLPYWHHLVLEDIGNLLGRFIKSDNERKDKGLFTYDRICVELDLSKGLPERLLLKHESLTWTQSLDYENTAFRCKFFHLTDHLQDTCPTAKKNSKKKKGTTTNRKIWQTYYEPYPDEDVGSEEEELHDLQGNKENLMNVESVDAEPTGQKIIGEDTQKNMENPKESPISGTKHAHESASSDSDKEQLTVHQPEEAVCTQMIVATPKKGVWIEVKSKKKGKKGKLEEYYNP